MCGWDSAGLGHKIELERVHRLSLLAAATGTNKRTSTKAIETYCDVESLQDRRDYLNEKVWNRIIRLDPEQHSVVSLYRNWVACGSPARPCLSFFPRAAALCKRLLRYIKFSNGGHQFLEPIPSPPIPKVRGNVRVRKTDKEAAKRSHRKLLRKLDPVSDGLIYTDGSAIPSPGRIGLGVAYIFNQQTFVFGKPF